MATLAASMALAGLSSAMSTTKQNKSISYQQEALQQNSIAAQNNAAVEMISRRKDANRTQAKTSAQMAATGIDSSSGSFLDLIGQGAAAGEMDVLKAKYDGDASAWSLNNKINELQTNKKNAWLEAGLAAGKTGLEGLSSLKKNPSTTPDISAVKKEQLVELNSGGSLDSGAAMGAVVA